jgi:hypothetical protein
MNNTLRKMLGIKWNLKTAMLEPKITTTNTIIGNRKLLILGHSLINQDQENSHNNSPETLLLKKMIQAMNLDLEQDVLISNVAASSDCIIDYTIKQHQIKPEVICIFGTNLINSPVIPNLALNKLRTLKLFYQEIPIVITFSLPYILRNPDVKPLVWNDLQKIMAILLNNLKNN